MSLKHAVLALLADSPRIGYQLKTDFETLTAGMWTINVGQIYTTLNRLTRDGLVESSDSETGNDQRTYTITSSGRDAVREWLTAPRPIASLDRDELTIKVAMLLGLDLVNANDALQLVDAQRDVAMNGLQQLMRQKSATPHDQLAQLAVLDAAAGRLDAELRWLAAVEERIVQSTKPDAAEIARRPPTQEQDLT